LTSACFLPPGWIMEDRTRSPCQCKNQVEPSKFSASESQFCYNNLFLSTDDLIMTGVASPPDIHSKIIALLMDLPPGF